jgi:hypothetical protein
MKRFTLQFSSSFSLPRSEVKIYALALRIRKIQSLPLGTNFHIRTKKTENCSFMYFNSLKLNWGPTLRMPQTSCIRKTKSLLLYRERIVQVGIFWDMTPCLWLCVSRSFERRKPASQGQIQEDRNRHLHCCENIITRNLVVYFRNIRNWRIHWMGKTQIFRC